MDPFVGFPKVMQIRTLVTARIITMTLRAIHQEKMTPLAGITLRIFGNNFSLRAGWHIGKTD